MAFATIDALKGTQVHALITCNESKGVLKIKPSLLNVQIDKIIIHHFARCIPLQILPCEQWYVLLTLAA